jgi:hypothetical protein
MTESMAPNRSLSEKSKTKDVLDCMWRLRRTTVSRTTFPFGDDCSPLISSVIVTPLHVAPGSTTTLEFPPN